MDDQDDYAQAVIGYLENEGFCPPGMELLEGTSKVGVHKLVEWIEVFTGYDANNRYEILDKERNRIYFALEQSSGCCFRFCLGNTRPFTILILDNQGRICLKIHRIFINILWYCLCGQCCFDEVHILTGDDELMGKIKKDFACCGSHFTIYDVDDSALLKIKGPCCMCGEVHFKVYNVDDVEIGEIYKKWGGWVKELLTTVITFGATFPLYLDTRLKALLLGAAFLIDFMFFEGPW